MPLASLNTAKIDYTNQIPNEPNGHCIVLIHGFASTKEVNWINTGWTKLLLDAGYQVICLDNRGHGASQKFHAEADYSLKNMAQDVIELLEYLSVENCHMMGYSMGARISASLVMEYPNKFGKVIFAGNGYNMIAGTGDWTPVRNALLAKKLEDVVDQRGRQFRAFADQTGSDRLALAACVIGAREMFTEEQFSKIENPTLIAIGTDDDVAGSGEQLAALIPNSKMLPIPDRDHMRAVGDKVYMQGVLDFLKTA